MARDTTDTGGRRLDAYIRVSDKGGREGESFISPDVQEDGIRAWARAHDHEVVEVHSEIDVSGGTMDRPAVHEVMRRISTGETDGVVVWALDRWGRAGFETYHAIERVYELGGEFHNVEGEFDLGTAGGRWMLTVMLQAAKEHRIRTKESYATGRTRAIERGVSVARTPFGFLRVCGKCGGNVPEGSKKVRPRCEGCSEVGTGRLKLDPATAPLVREAFEMRAAGQTLGDIRDYLNRHATTSSGARFSNATVGRMFGMVAYRGVGGGKYGGAREGAHPRIVDDTTWYAAKDRRVPRRGGSPMEIVSLGLVRCAACRYTMRPMNERHTGGYRYVCGRHAAARDCPAPVTIVATNPRHVDLDDILVEWMWSQQTSRFDALDDSLDTTDLERERAELVARREADRLDDELRDALGRAEWLRHLKDLTTRITAFSAEIVDRQRQAGRLKSRKNLVELKQEWPHMPIAARRAQLASVIAHVFVREGDPDLRPARGADASLRRDFLLERIHIVSATDPDVDVPRQGRRLWHPEKNPSGYRMATFHFPDADPRRAGIAAA